MPSWEHVLSHIGLIKASHDRKKLKFGLAHFTPGPYKKKLDDIALAAALKEIRRKHEILGHGEKPGSYFAILLDTDKKKMEGALARFKAVFKKQGLSAEFKSVIYPDDGNEMDELLQKLEPDRSGGSS